MSDPAVTPHDAGAGVDKSVVERALREEIWCLRQIVTGIRIMDNAGNFKQFDGEPWLKRVRNIDLHHDPVETALRDALALPRADRAGGAT